MPRKDRSSVMRSGQQSRESRGGVNRKEEHCRPFDMGRNKATSSTDLISGIRTTLVLYNVGTYIERPSKGYEKRIIML